MIQYLYRFLIELTNGKWTSSLLAKFVCSPISKTFIPLFSKAFKIDLSELEKPLSEYTCLHEFFIRRLKEGVRTNRFHPYSLVSPVDAIIQDIGIIGADHVIIVKDKEYSILEMVGKKSKLKNYINGKYMIFYLSPSHYHRIHSPMSGHIKDQWILGKKSYPVNRLGLKYGKSPLSKNFRFITEIVHKKASILVIKVGAMYINSIEWTHEGDELNIGDEIAYFSFGSTVVLLFEKDKFRLEPFEVPHHIKVGETIGTIHPRT